ncbi:LacI family DNA-binding transcriptional regulator [Streptomyces spiralis]|uniref:LacI family DNA-binding transcriptional regulator n=1 Tax=Streptomyces spiralis TaxID=66376 RepID=UPI0033C1C5C1
MSRHKSQVNMADVARVTGLSLSSVSRALRGASGVGEETRRRVMEAADQLSYVVSPEASRLAGGSTGRVALIVPMIDYWFYAAMVAAIERVLREAELDVLLYHVEDPVERRRFFEQLPARRKVDAVIMIALPVPDEEAKRLDMMGVHIVVAGGRLFDHPCVRIDDVEVGCTATNHLMRLGHHRIAMIYPGPPEGAPWAPVRDRCQGYRDALTSSGLEVDEQLMVSLPWPGAGGTAAMAPHVSSAIDRLFSLRNPPTALFAFSDELAITATRMLLRAHMAVPEQISVIGVDDHPMADLHDLTTVRQPVADQGALAARMVLDLLNGRSLTNRDVVLPTQLVLRRSVAPPTPGGACTAP